MSSEMAKQRTFQERMADRIRESIGELMTDEELKKLIERSVEEFLFRSRIGSEKGYGVRSTEPPLMQELTEEFMKPMMEKAVRAWLLENKEKLADMMKKQIDRDAAKVFLQAISITFEHQMDNFRNNMVDKINNIQTY